MMLGAVLDIRCPFFAEHGLDCPVPPDRRTEQAVFRPRGFKLHPLVEVSVRLDRMTLLGAELVFANAMLRHPARRFQAYNLGAAFLEFMVPRQQLSRVEHLVTEAAHAVELARSSEGSVSWLQPGRDFSLNLEGVSIRSSAHPERTDRYRVAVGSDAGGSRPWWKSLF
ncbi:MAG: hypothetical protein HY319_23560 [Armatimonadetes bacterium]|nr:hypothetical protein [Armatimonadota bacterium]